MTRYRYRYRRSHYVEPEKLLRRAAILLLVVIVIAAAFIGTLYVRVEKIDLKVSGLPDQLRNLRIAYLSDIHYGTWFSQARVEKLVQRLNDYDADIVILGGDYGTDPEGAIAFFDILPKIETRQGVYAVVGDTDRSLEDGELDRLLTAMRQSGVTGLVNDRVTLTFGEATLQIVGLDDYRTGYPDADAVAKKVKAGDFVIVVGHSPDLLPAIHSARSGDESGHWYDMALFGHTHGGQINLLGYTPFRKLRSLAGQQYHQGWLEENRAQVLITNGVGTEYLPLRLFAAPQIHLITLKRGS